MHKGALDDRDEELIDAARDVLRRNHRPGRHTVGAAVRCSSGAIYTGVNVEACGYGPCAEHIAVGTAFSNGESDLVAIVAVKKKGTSFAVISPCGSCRQLIVDYAPGATVIFCEGDRIQKARAADLLPGAYRYDFD
jgi:cytidine deaminase